MLGLIGGAMKAPKKPKTAKIDVKKFTGDVEGAKKKAKSAPKGEIVPTTMKIVDVKAGTEKRFNLKGDNPIQEQFLVLYENTFAIKKALETQNKSKKKRAKQKKSLFEWFWRKQREEDREEKGKGIKLKTGIGTAIVSKAQGIFDIIMQIISTLFAGWLLNYIPQIMGFVKKFVGIVTKIVDFFKPIVKFFWDIGHWITKKGLALFATLAGVKPDDALKNSIIQNLNEIEKRFPLIEAAFAGFLVFKTLKFTKGLSQLGKPKPGTGTQAQRLRQTGQGGNRFNSMRRRLRTSSASQNVRNRFARRFGGTASQRRFGGQVAGRTASRGQRLMTGLRAGASKSKAMLGKVGKLAKVPFIGGLIVAVTQLLAGEPLGKAVFMGAGAGLGGILGGLLGAAGGPLAIVGALLGEIIGTFVGELLYEGFMGKGWSAAGKKLTETLKGIWDATGGALLEWIGGVFGRFWDLFMEKHSIAVGVGSWSMKAPDPLAIANPFITAPLLFKAFFGPAEEGDKPGDKDKIDTGDKSNSTSSPPPSNEANVPSPPIAGSNQQSSNADAISHSASYDVPQGDATIIAAGGNSPPPSPPSGGHGSSSFVGGNSFEAAALNRKASNLAKLWA